MAEAIAMETSSSLNHAFETPIGRAVDFLNGETRNAYRKRDESLVDIELAAIDRLDVLIKQNRGRR